jgi:hypothetical protein
VDIDGARVAREGVAPDALEQLVAREHEAPVVEEVPEQVELLGRQLHLLAGDGHLAPTRVDSELAVLENRAHELPSLGAGTAEDRLDAGDELAGVEGLRQVVVRAHLEPDDLVDVLVSRAEHENRNVGALADAATDVDPVEIGQHQVEDDQQGRARARLLDGVAARAGTAHVEAGALEVHPHERRDARLVLDDENRLFRRAHSPVWWHNERPAGTALAAEDKRRRFPRPAPERAVSDLVPAAAPFVGSVEGQRASHDAAREDPATPDDHLPRAASLRARDSTANVPPPVLDGRVVDLDTGLVAVPLGAPVAHEVDDTDAGVAGVDEQCASPRDDCTAAAVRELEELSVRRLHEGRRRGCSLGRPCREGRDDDQGHAEAHSNPNYRPAP